MIILHLDAPSRHFLPGEEITGTFRLAGIRPGDLQRLEFSVLWFTEGKGDEDMGVHHFESVSWDVDEDTPADTSLPGTDRVLTGDTKMTCLRQRDADRTYSFRVPLPASPLSYYGLILKIRWCVRVRIFLKNGREMMDQKPFLLGDLPPVEVSLT